MPSISPEREPRKWTTSITGKVWSHDTTATSGLNIRTDAPNVRPPVGTEVTITWERQPTREEAVRQVIHDALLNDSLYLGVRTEISTPRYATAEGPVDPFSEIARRVLDALDGAE